MHPFLDDERLSFSELCDPDRRVVFEFIADKLYNEIFQVHVSSDIFFIDYKGL